MDEEQKKQVAVFRFGVIADFVTGARLPRRTGADCLRRSAPENGPFLIHIAPASAKARCAT